MTDDPSHHGIDTAQSTYDAFMRMTKIGTVIVMVVVAFVLVIIT